MLNSCSNYKIINIDDINLSDLVGSKIVNIGTFQEHVTDNGFVIDYEKNNKIKRIVLGYNELGMWLHWKGDQNSPNHKDEVLAKLDKFFEQIRPCRIPPNLFVG